jgi:negative regulator of flagellin synthesis FlgM
MKVKDASEIRRLDVAKPNESKSTQAGSGTSVTPDKVSTDSSAQVVAAGAAARTALSQDQGLRLEAITAAVRDGTFKPDPQRIAQKILDDAELTAMLQTMLGRA